MKYKLAVLSFFLMSLPYNLRATETLADTKEKLVEMLGNEFIARSGAEYSQETNVNTKKQLLDNIRNEIRIMDCFEISDFFGNPNNKDANNRELDMTLWQQITINCSNIMQDPGPVILAEQVVFYFINNLDKGGIKDVQSY